MKDKFDKYYKLWQHAEKINNHYNKKLNESKLNQVTVVIESGPIKKNNKRSAKVLSNNDENVNKKRKIINA